MLARAELVQRGQHFSLALRVPGGHRRPRSSRRGRRAASRMPADRGTKLTERQRRRWRRGAARRRMVEASLAHEPPRHTQLAQLVQPAAS